MGSITVIILSLAIMMVFTIIIYKHSLCNIELSLEDSQDATAQSVT